jgi:hypothetical protein
MPILVFTILMPTLAFYFYALVQFWLEFRRRRHGEIKVVELHNTRLAPDDFEPFPETQPEGETEPATRATAGIRPFVIPAAMAHNAASALLPQVLLAYPNNRFVACGSPAAAPALKRAAKG